MATSIGPCLRAAVGVLVSTLASALLSVIAPGLRVEAQPVFSDLRFTASDLIDDMVYSWLDDKTFAGARFPLALTDVRAPVGIDQRFDLVVENRLYELLQLNKQVPITLVHCAACRELITKSNPDKTYMGIGADEPEILAGIERSNPGILGLSLMFEATGDELELRAVVYELKAPQKIVWAQRYSTSITSALALQRGDQLLSLKEARRRNNDILAQRDPLETTSYFLIRLYMPKAEGTITPLPFIEQAFDGVLLPDRATRVGLNVGFTSIRDAYEGWSAGARAMRLLFGDTPHPFNPDLYAVFGFNYVRLRGPGATVFAEDEIDPDRIRNETKEPRATLLSYRLGFEVHVKFRFGLIAILEYSPMLKESETIVTKKLLGIPYQNYGLGLVLRW